MSKEITNNIEESKLNSSNTKDKNIIYNSNGRKKTSVARVFIKKGIGNLKIRKNKKDLNILDEINTAFHNHIIAPLKILDVEKEYDILCTVKGGGVTSQAESIGFGIAKVLLKIISSEKGIDEAIRVKSILRKSCYITVDSRIVERKKTGLKKARKAEQFSKR